MRKMHLIATFLDPHQAEQAYRALERVIPKDDISFVHMPNLEENETVDASSDGVLDGVGWGAAIGGVGGLLIGLSMLLIPGIGPILAAGPISAALGGVTYGGIIGGLIDMGINRHTAERIEEHIKSGAIVITAEVPSPEQGQTMKRIFAEYQAQEVVEEPVQ